MKRLLFALIFVGLGYALFLIAVLRLNDGFSVAKIQSDLTVSPKWEVANPPPQKIRDLLSQNFYYLGKGSQCYVFESEDHDIVIKFFRFPRYRLPKLASHLSLPSFLAEIQNRKKNIKEGKLNRLFRSCKIAFEELHEESGLLYLHLNKTASLHTKVTLYDKLKRAHYIEIDDYEFMIQKKGEQIFPYLDRLIRKEKKEEAKRALSDLAFLISIRIKKGIADHDAVIHKNSGFRSGEAMFLDVGGFTRNQIFTNNPHQEAFKITSKLRSWLHEKDPELADYFVSLLNLF